MEKIETLIYSSTYGILNKKEVEDLGKRFFYVFSGVILGIFALILIVGVSITYTKYAYAQTPHISNEGDVWYFIETNNTYDVEVNFSNNSVELTSNCLNEDFFYGWYAEIWNENEPFLIVSANKTGDTFTFSLPKTLENEVWYIDMLCEFDRTPTVVGESNVSPYGSVFGASNGVYAIVGITTYPEDDNYALLFILTPSPTSGGGGYFGNMSPMIASVGGGVGGTLGSIMPILAVIIGLALAVAFVPIIANDMFVKPIKKSKKEEKELYKKADKAHADFEKITKKK